MNNQRKQVGYYKSNKGLLSFFQFLLLQQLTQKKIKDCSKKKKQKAENYLVLSVPLAGSINFLCSTMGKAADRSGSWICCLWVFCWCMSASFLVKYYGPILLPTVSVICEFPPKKRHRAGRKTASQIAYMCFADSRLYNNFNLIFQLWFWTKSIGFETVTAGITIFSMYNFQDKTRHLKSL